MVPSVGFRQSKLVEFVVVNAELRHQFEVGDRTLEEVLLLESMGEDLLSLAIVHKHWDEEVGEQLQDVIDELGPIKVVGRKLPGDSLILHGHPSLPRGI